MPVVTLLDDRIYVVATLLVLLGLCGGAFLTSRTPRRTWGGTALNALVILVASALIMAGSFLALNRVNGWFSAVGDIVGATGDEARTTLGGTGPFAGEEIKPGTVGALAPLPEPGSQIQHVKVPTSLGGAWDVLIILPDGYFDPANANRLYPVLFAGHGVPGTPEAYLGAFDLRGAEADAVAAKKISPFVTVVPNILPEGYDNECIYGSRGPRQLEDWLASDIPTFLKGHLRVRHDRTSWAWFGFSAGGYCGAMIAMRHPEAFAGAVSLGGYYAPTWENKTPNLTPAQLAAYDLPALARATPPRVALWVQASKTDVYSWPSVQALLGAVREPTSVTAVIDEAGSHSPAAWAAHIPETLEWLGRTIPGFAAS